MMVSSHLFAVKLVNTQFAVFNGMVIYSKETTMMRWTINNEPGELLNVTGGIAKDTCGDDVTLKLEFMQF